MGRKMKTSILVSIGKECTYVAGFVVVSTTQNKSDKLIKKVISYPSRSPEGNVHPSANHVRGGKISQ